MAIEHPPYMEKLMKIICNWEFFHCHVWLPEGKNGSHSLLCDGVSKTTHRKTHPWDPGKVCNLPVSPRRPLDLRFWHCIWLQRNRLRVSRSFEPHYLLKPWGLWSFWGVSDFSTLFGSPRYVHGVCRMPHVGARGQSRCSRWASSEPTRLDFERLVARNIPDFSPLLMEPYYSYMSYGQYSWLITINRG